jgi:hypothetical protein
MDANHKSEGGQGASAASAATGSSQFQLPPDAERRLRREHMLAKEVVYAKHNNQSSLASASATATSITAEQSDVTSEPEWREVPVHDSAVMKIDHCTLPLATSTSLLHISRADG